MPDKVGRVRSNSAVCLEPGREYLLWGKLPKVTVVSPGSAVMTALTSCRSAPRGILVARIVTPLWGDRWVLLKAINTSDRPVLVRRNAKLADVFPCIALEEMSGNSYAEVPLTRSPEDSASFTDEKPESIELIGLDINSCDVSEQCKGKLTELIMSYIDIFSQHNLDCGEAKGFVHCIHQITGLSGFHSGEYPQGQYQKLRQVLSEMEERRLSESQPVSIISLKIMGIFRSAQIFAG